MNQYRLPTLSISILASLIALTNVCTSQALLPPSWDIFQDADQDGMTDVDEILWNMDPLDPADGNSDLDGDQLSFAWEYALGTDPALADTDADGWSDSDELLLYGTDPLSVASFPLTNPSQNSTAAATGSPASTDAEPSPTDPPPPPPPPSLANGDFTDVGITTWKSMLGSKQYQNKGFVWGAGAVASWSAYVGSTVEVWDSGGEKFIELDGSPGNYGIKQPIANAKAGAYILAWKQSGRNTTQAGSDPYLVKVYYMNGTTEVPIGQSAEFTNLNKLAWTDNAFGFQITPEQLTAAGNNPIYVAFLPTGSLNTYGTLIDKVSIAPFEVKAFKRGTINTPGPEVPAGTGEYGYETVMMENADSESSDKSSTRDCDESGTTADLNEYRKEHDNDLVKVVLKWPVGVKPSGASLKLLHDGMQVDATKSTADTAVSISGNSQLNFYKADGTRITNPTSDLQIADLSNAPSNSYLSKILTEGEVTIFIEGANRFGDLPAKQMAKLGGALLGWQYAQGGTKLTTKLLVYRGGFLRFMQPAGVPGINEPGAAGSFEFWDGKGRVRQKFGGHTKEFQEDETHYGKLLKTWTARSGKLRDGSQGGLVGGRYNIEGKNGHTPPGWWWQRERTPLTGNQLSTWRGAGNDLYLKQGNYCRWIQDNAADPARYTQTFRYYPNNTRDAEVGLPLPNEISFKFDMFPISPTTSQNRIGIQIHPDGQRDGTAGCIGIQNYDHCREVLQSLRGYHGLKVKVQIPQE